MNIPFKKQSWVAFIIFLFLGSSLLLPLSSGIEMHTTLLPIDASHATSGENIDRSITERDTTFVIITPPVFYDYSGPWNLQQLANWHNNNDTITAYVISLTDIYSNASFWVNGTWGDANPNNPFKRIDEDPITKYNMFNDSQAKIRNYLRYAYIHRNVRYALLVGDADDSNPLFPIRECYSRADGAPLETLSPVYELIPTDMYYACLHGTFNADEDSNSESSHSGFGENATESADGIDECDWDYDIAVGRFPVDDTTELRNIIRKTIAYMSLTGTENYLQNITLAGQGGGFGGITTWMCNYSKTLNGTTYNTWKDGVTTHGFNADTYQIKILDANPNREEGEPFYDVNSRGDFNNGVHIFYESSHGSINGWAANGGEGESFTIEDVLALTNTQYCFVISAMPCNTATFDEYPETFGEVFVTDEHGAFAYLGNTRYGFGSYANEGLNASSHRLGAEILDAWLYEGYQRLGDLIGDSKQDVRNWHDNLGDQSIRYAMYEQILFGSPAVTLHTVNNSNDTIPPVISNVQATPAVQYSGGNVNISATVTDNTNVDEVFLIIQSPVKNTISLQQKRTTLENISITQNKSGNTYYCNRTYQQPGTYQFYIWANDTSGNSRTSPLYTFQIVSQNTPPTVGTPIPTNGSTGNPLDFLWSITINDPDGDWFNWMIQCSNGQSANGTGASNGTKSLSLSGLTYMTSYTVWVNATDPLGSGLYTRRWYMFKTKTANNPPVFGTPSPENGSTENPLSFNWSIPIHDPEGDHFTWMIQCSNGQTTSSENATNGTKTLTLTGLEYETIYTVWVNATDPTGSSNYTRTWYTFTTKANLPPTTPTITGFIIGKINTSIDYTFVTIDPDDDPVYYFIDWGDSTNSSWIGPYPSGEQITKSHTWSKKGTYTIRAKAKDVNNLESDYAELTVIMPYNYRFMHHPLANWLLEWLLNRLPLLRLFLQQKANLFFLT